MPPSSSHPHPSCPEGPYHNPLACCFLPGLFILWDFWGLEMLMHTKGPASPFSADHRGENQMVPCFLQACGSLLGGYSLWEERSGLLDKEKGLAFFLLQCFAVCLSYFCSFFHPCDGMRPSIGCFHGLVSERALQELKRWVIIKSLSCSRCFEATPGPAR